MRGRVREREAERVRICDQADKGWGSRESGKSE